MLNHCGFRINESGTSMGGPLNELDKQIQVLKTAYGSSNPTEIAGGLGLVDTLVLSGLEFSDIRKADDNDRLVLGMRKYSDEDSYIVLGRKSNKNPSGITTSKIVSSNCMVLDRQMGSIYPVDGSSGFKFYDFFIKHFITADKPVSMSALSNELIVVLGAKDSLSIEGKVHYPPIFYLRFIGDDILLVSDTGKTTGDKEVPQKLLKIGRESVIAGSIFALKESKK